MNPEITSQEKILAQCRAIAKEEGLNAITMRHVAEKLDVSLGSLYHYFPSKEALLLASVSSIWHDIFHEKGDSFQRNDFLSLLRYFFQALRDGEVLYPGFFSLHALAFTGGEKKAGVEEREGVFAHMKQEMLATLSHDPKIRPNAFERTSKEDFVDLVFLEILAIHLSQKDSENAFLATVEQLIY
jgi:TetR/AcrR family transcriptional regulator, cholesterol catabolism regulator